MNLQIRKAQRKKSKLRLALIGPSGTGKTMSSLLIARGIGKKILLVDTEAGSGDLYAHLFDYDIVQISAPFLPEKYIEALELAQENNYDVVILDSLSHAWAGEGGLLDQQGKIADSGKGNSWTAWRTITPQHNQLVDTILQSNLHVITTIRAKTEHVQDKDSDGKTVIKKVGLAPIQRDGLEYEFTVVFDIDSQHFVSASKDRTGMFDKQYIKPSEKLGEKLKDWLEEGTDPFEIIKKQIEEAKTFIDLKNVYETNTMYAKDSKFTDLFAKRKKEIQEELEKKEKGKEEEESKEKKKEEKQQKKKEKETKEKETKEITDSQTKYFEEVKKNIEEAKTLEVLKSMYESHSNKVFKDRGVLTAKQKMELGRLFEEKSHVLEQQ